MNILIIGASRGVGKALLTCCLDEGHSVTVLARSPAKIETKSPQLKVIEGDILDRETLSTAIAGVDAVCSCVGVPITFKPVDLFSRGAQNIIDILQEHHSVKFISVTGIGAGDSKGHGGFLYDKIFKPLFLKTIYEDKDREEDIIQASSADWLIVRPAGLTNGPRTGTYRVLTELEGITAKRISRMDVADFILSQLDNPSHFGKTPLLTY